MKIAILYNYWLNKKAPKDRRISDNDIIKTVKIVRDVLKQEHRVKPIRYEDGVINKIKEDGFEFVFNLCEGIRENNLGEAEVALKLDSIKMPYTGSGPLCLETCLNKKTTKDILTENGINTPQYVLFSYSRKTYDFDIKLNYPLIVKPVHEDGSVGITEKSVVDNKDQLIEIVEYVLKTYEQDVLVEEFIDDTDLREINVSILGNNGSIQALPASEIVFKRWKNTPKIVSFVAKWDEQSELYKKSVRICPTKISRDLEEKIVDMAIRAYQVTKCRDYGRIDFRINNRGIYVLEVNPNPGIGDDSGFYASAKASGLSYKDLIKKILSEASKRYEIKI